MAPQATVRGIGRQAQAIWPQVSPAVAELVRLAEDELYGERGFRGVDPTEVRRLWKSIRGEIRAGEHRVSE
jgi:hypothetical protein